MKKYYIDSKREEYPEVNRRKAKWVDHILGRNCLLSLPLTFLQ